MARVHVRESHSARGLRKLRKGDLLIGWTGGEGRVCSRKDHQCFIPVYTGLSILAKIEQKPDPRGRLPLLQATN